MGRTTSQRTISEERQQILAFIEDFATEMGDEAPLRSSVSRAYNLYQESGMPIGAFVSFLYEARALTKEAAEEFGGATVLAAVPMINSWKKRDRPLVVSLARPMSPAAEAYRSLRTSLQFARQEREVRTILVTSPAPAEGKTSTLANLGAMFAQAGERVVLVSCDLRKPRLGEFFGVDARLGLTTAILAERTGVREFAMVLAVGDLSFQQKCLSKISSVAGQGRTVVFVSHNLPAIRRLCPRALVLMDGTLKFDGAVESAIQYYLNGGADESTLSSHIFFNTSAKADEPFAVQSVEMRDEFNDMLKALEQRGAIALKDAQDKQQPAPV